MLTIHQPSYPIRLKTNWRHIAWFLGLTFVVLVGGSSVAFKRWIDKSRYDSAFAIPNVSTGILCYIFGNFFAPGEQSTLNFFAAWLLWAPLSKG